MALLMLAMLLAGIHMMVQPRVYVGRGPIPAQSARNVRAMGILFATMGGSVTAVWLVPVLLFQFA